MAWQEVREIREPGPLRAFYEQWLTEQLKLLPNRQLI